MASIRPLPRLFPPLPYDVSPLARLHPDGALELLGPEFPAPGDLLLALWTPGEAPSFRLAAGRLSREGRAWRVSGTQSHGWVVAWAPRASLVP